MNTWIVRSDIYGLMLFILIDLWLRTRIITGYLCWDFDGLHGYTIQDAISALR